MPSGTDLTSSTPTLNGADRRNSTDGNGSFTRTVSFVISLIILFFTFSKSFFIIFALNWLLLAG